ncbi:MAG: hypothetical protein AMXMBFR20_02270 [Planctomycetia bacterium]
MVSEPGSTGTTVTGAESTRSTFAEAMPGRIIITASEVTMAKDAETLFLDDSILSLIGQHSLALSVSTKRAKRTK